MAQDTKILAATKIHLIVSSPARRALQYRKRFVIFQEERGSASRKWVMETKEAAREVGGAPW
jgi:hypothetical protein